MKYEDYLDFYEKVINEYIKELKTFDIGFNSLTINRKSKKKIYKLYEKKRIEIRSNYMLDSSKPIDRHKTASCMMYAILNAKVFKVNYFIHNLPEQLSLANEYLAVFVGFNIVELYKRRDDFVDRNIERSNYNLIIPNTEYEVMNSKGEMGDSFISSLCLSLFNIKKVNRFDVFAYATILFLLENRTDMILNGYEKEELITI